MTSFVARISRCCFPAGWSVFRYCTPIARLPCRSTLDAVADCTMRRLFAQALPGPSTGVT